jgi:hypothetical protein
MSFYIKLQEHRLEPDAPRGRRARKLLRLEPESLESRTPMSSGLGSALESIVITRAAEFGIVIADTPALVTTSARAEDSEQAVSNIELDLVGERGVLAVAESTLPALASASENSQSNEAVVAESTPVSRPDDVSGELLAIAPLQATSDAARGGGSGILSAIEPVGIAGIVTELREYGVDSPFGPGGAEEVHFFPPLLGFIMGPTMGRVTPQTGPDDNEPDMSYSGPLEPILATAVPADFSSTTPSSGRTLAPVFAGRSLQLEPYGEYSNTSGLSFLAAGQGTPLSFQATAHDDLLAWEETTAEPVSPGSIITGGLSLKNLLSGPDTSTLTNTSCLEQVAELVPLPESALALAATLWTRPSDSPSSTVRWHLAAEEAITARAGAEAASSWMLFVAGVDQALEQTCRELQESMPTTLDRQRDDGNPNSPDELLEWHGPMLPAAQPAQPETHTKLPVNRLGQADGVAGQASAPSRQNARPTQGTGQAVALASMPTISVVSVFTVIAAWVWRKRQQWRSSLSGPASGHRLLALNRRPHGSA